MHRTFAAAAALSVTMTVTAAIAADQADTFAWSTRRAGDGTWTAALASASRAQFRARCDGATGEFLLDYFPDFDLAPGDALGFSKVWDGPGSIVMLKTRLLAPRHLRGRIAPTPRLLEILASKQAGLIAPSEMDEREPLLDSGALARVAGSCRPPRAAP